MRREWDLSTGKEKSRVKMAEGAKDEGIKEGMRTKREGMERGGLNR